MSGALPLKSVVRGNVLESGSLHNRFRKPLVHGVEVVVLSFFVPTQIQEHLHRTVQAPGISFANPAQALQRVILAQEQLTLGSQLHVE